MIVAEVVITSAGSLIGAGLKHALTFDTLEGAEKVYHEIADLLGRRLQRANDLPAKLDVVGTGSRISLAVDAVQSVTLHDYAITNEHQTGLTEAFPNLFRRTGHD